MSTICDATASGAICRDLSSKIRPMLSWMSGGMARSGRVKCLCYHGFHQDLAVVVIKIERKSGKERAALMMVGDKGESEQPSGVVMGPHGHTAYYLLLYPCGIRQLNSIQ